MALKKLSLFALFILFLSGFGFSQTTGELLISVSTSSTGGNYSPRNVLAIWIEDDAGNFVKSCLVYANKRITHLNTWQASTTKAGSEYNRVDAITGATQSNHGTRTCTWDGTDYNGNPMPDGTYKVWMELTDKNATGNYSSFSFTKSAVKDVQNPANVSSFSNVEITWEPSGSSSVMQAEKNDIIIYPTPVSGLYKISGSNITKVEILDMSGKLLFFNNSNEIDLTTSKNGIYLVKIISIDGSVVIKKLSKR